MIILIGLVNDLCCFRKTLKKSLYKTAYRTNTAMVSEILWFSVLILGVCPSFSTNQGSKFGVSHNLSMLTCALKGGLAWQSIVVHLIGTVCE